MKRVVSILLIAVLVGFGGPPPALGSDPLDDVLDLELRAARETRAAFGLPTDDETLSRLYAFAGLEGMSEFGVPLSREELATLDLPGRFRWQNDLAAKLLPYAMSLPTYAGSYFDPTDGALTVMVTEDDRAVRLTLENLLPEVSRGFTLALADHTFAELQGAARAVSDAWASTRGAPSLVSVGVDTRENALVVGLAAQDVEAGIDTSKLFASAVGVAIRVEVVEPPQDTACTNRDNCVPLRAGVRIAKGDTTIDDCTMAWHVYDGTDESFITAGHCGYSGPNCWYHEGYNGPNGRRVGCEMATLLGPNGVDIMKVGTFDDQANELVYGVGTFTNLAGYYLEGCCEGMTVTASRGKANAISTGVVTEGWESWLSNLGGNVWVWGMDTTLPSIGGDSGSPVFVDGAEDLVIGTLSNTAGNVAYYDSIRLAWGTQLFGLGAPE